MNINSQHYAQLFIDHAPMIDVRAPVEFQRGAFPAAKNLPLLDNVQRETVGKCYKQHGQNKAIAKGHELIRGDVRESRIAAWKDFTEQHPDALLYCFRGGLRSEISQRWLQEAGVDIPRIEGGYKALRSFLIDTLENSAPQCTFQLIGGKTGSAKTDLINALDNGVDLEAAAHHRGSSFGRHAKAQNSQINFENSLAIDFLRLRHRNISSIVLEDEGRMIGRAGLPKTLFSKMRVSPIVVIEMPFETRLHRLLQEYVVDMHAEFEALNSDTAFDAFSAYLLQGLERIKKRLGSAHFAVANKAMQHALHQQQRTGDIAQHRAWLEILLTHYYDPLYDYGLNLRKDYVCFRGDYQSCAEYLRSQV